MAQKKKAAPKRTETVASPAGLARKQARIQKNEQLHREKQRFGGLGADERRFLEKEGYNLDLHFSALWRGAVREVRAQEFRKEIIKLKKAKKQADAMKRFLAERQQIKPTVEVPNGLDEFAPAGV